MSDCNVCLGSEPDCMAEFYESATVKARKAHRCEECREEITKGAMYLRECGKWDGVFYSMKTCLVCAELRTAFTCDGDGIMYGELWSEIRQNLFPTMTTGCLEKVRTVAAKQFLVDRWNQWKFKWAEGARK